MAGKPNGLSKSANERLERVRIEQRYSTARIAIRWIGIGSVVYFAKDAIVALSGQSTTVVIHAVLSMLADIQFTVAIALTGAATVWAVCERALRRRKVENMQSRIRHFESIVDPNRTSTGLLSNGKTNPADDRKG